MEPDLSPIPQLLEQRMSGRLCDPSGHERIGSDRFRFEGQPLSDREKAALQVRMPLHRGPHRDDKATVAERVGRIVAGRARMRMRASEVALDDAARRLDLLQRPLRRLPADDRPKTRLNRQNPLELAVDFTDLDALADALWSDTSGPAAEGGPAGPSASLIETTA